MEFQLSRKLERAQPFLSTVNVRYWQPAKR